MSQIKRYRLQSGLIYTASHDYFLTGVTKTAHYERCIPLPSDFTVKETEIHDSVPSKSKSSIIINRNTSVVMSYCQYIA